MAKKAAWTFMVYMAGDNSLSEAGDVDLDEMRQVGSTASVNVVAEFDNEGDSGTNRYLIRKGGGDQVESLGETDSGDPAVLNEFIAWAVETYPADHYGLILWNHGGGWEPDDFDQYAKTIRAKSFTIREAGQLTGTQLKKSLFRSTLKEILGRGSARERAICADDGSGHSLDTLEVGKVLAKTKKVIGGPLDVLGLDACLMSNLEVAYEAAPNVKYLVGSEESEPNNGWPYDTIIKALTAKPKTTPAALTTGIVKSYIDFYKKTGESGVTQSAFNLAKVEDTARSVDALADALLDHMPKARDEILKAQKKSMPFFYSKLWDIKQFAKEVAKASSDASVKTAAAAVQKTLKPGAKNFVLAKKQLGSEYAPCGGLSIYLVPPTYSVSAYYKDLAFATKYPGWQNMLTEYLSE
jgi:hypothetical protein